MWCVRSGFNWVLGTGGGERILLLGRGQPEMRKVNPSLPQHCQTHQNEEDGSPNVVSLRSRAPKQQQISWLLLLVYFVLIGALRGCDMGLVLSIPAPPICLFCPLFTRGKGKPTCLGELHVLIVKLTLGNCCLFNSAVPEAIPVVWNHSLGTVELAPWSFLGFWLERKPEAKGPYSIITATIASTLGLAQRIYVLKIVLKKSFLKNAKNTGILKFGSRNSLLLFLQALQKQE